MIKSYIFFLSLCLTWLSDVAISQEATITEVTTVEGITEYALNNGLRVLLFSDQSKPQVTINVTYLVGSRHEGYGETGMAHLLEHLVFKGTPNHEDITKELKERGAFFNGTTWYDRTNYFQTLNATDENLEWALKMEADRMVNSFISAEDLESEMTVVRNEFEMGENRPTSVLMKRVMASSFQWHNYGKTTIGARADLENVPIDRLQAFYREYYQPDNAILLVVGKFEKEKTIEWILKYFGAIPRPERVIMTTYTREPTQDGEKEVTLRRVGDVQALAAVYHVCAGSHPDFAPLSLLKEVLTDAPSGRLYKALVEAKKTTNVWGFVPALKEPGFLYLGADVLKDKSLDEAKAALTATLDGLKDNPPTPEEVERAKTKLLKNIELSFNDSRRVGIFMSGYIAAGDWRLAYIYRDRLKEASVEDVIRVANKYLKPSNRTVGRFIPEQEPDRVDIPEAPDIMSIVADYKGGEAVSEGEVFDPTPHNIESRVKREINKHKVSYVFMPKDTRGDAVRAQISLKFGAKDNLSGKGTIAGITGSMINKGSETMSRQEIQDTLDKLKTNARINGYYHGLNVSIETERDFLPEAIRLVCEIIKSPAFPEDEFSKLIDQRLAQLEEQKSQPMALAQNEIQRIINPYPKDDVRYNTTFEEDIEALQKVTLDEVKIFYKEFYGASDATVTVVGDFDQKEIQAILDEELKEWHSHSGYTRMDAFTYEVEAQNTNIETPDKANAGFFAGYTFKMQDNHKDYPALMLANYIFGGGSLSSRLADRIRQKDGLSYGEGSYMNANPYVPKTTWGAYAMYAPENVEALEKAFKEELEKAVKDGFTEQEVEDAKKGWLQQRQVSRSQDGYLTSVLNTYVEQERNMMWEEELENKVSKLSAEQVSAAFRNYIIPDKISYVKAGDFAKNEIKP